MQVSQTISPPFVRQGDSTSRVMADVLIALMPCIFMSWLAFGAQPLMAILLAVVVALLTEWLFSLIYSGNTKSLTDGSAIVTSILMVFTIGPFTPLYVVAFGSAMAILFGKLLWGGLGRNLFNPALVGRAFMAVFFPAAMVSPSSWYDSQAVNVSTVTISGDTFLNMLFFKPTGAIGEYSIFCLVLGGMFLLMKRRISWHIPCSLCITFTAGLLFFPSYHMAFSLAGVLLGAIFMATDMPTSSSTRFGKLYYGAMIGIVAIICIMNEARYEYMSYAILLLNAFVRPINWVFRPQVWGIKQDVTSRLWQAAVLTGVILAACFAVIYLYRFNAMQYLVFAYIIFCITRFVMGQLKTPEKAIVSDVSA